MFERIIEPFYRSRTAEIDSRREELLLRSTCFSRFQAIDLPRRKSRWLRHHLDADKS
jgi:hypothetical protein